MIALRLRDTDAFAHPAYNASVRHAADRAFRERDPKDRKNDPCFSVYYDGTAIYVRDSKAAPPPDSKCICIAQYWGFNDRADGGKWHRVQLRFDGAHSEWVDF